MCAGLVWLLLTVPVFAQGAATLYVQESEPNGPPFGAIWYQPSTGTLKVVETVSPLVWGDVGGGAGGAAWGSVTGTLSDQTDLQTALDSKQVAGSYATGGGTATGTNTGDQTTITGNAGSATVLQTARTINGVSFNGSANITVAAAGSTLSDTVTVAKGGTGLTALGTSLQVLRTNAAANALEYATISGGSGPTLLRVASDVSNTTTTFADVTGLTMAVTSGTTYQFSCPLTYTTAATTTALQLSVNGPSMTALDYSVLTSTTATAMHSAAQTAVDTNTNPATGGGTTRLPVTISGSFVPSANGTFAIRLRSEVSTSAVVVKRGSWCAVF